MGVIIIINYKTCALFTALVAHSSSALSYDWPDCCSNPTVVSRPCIISGITSTG